MTQEHVSSESIKVSSIGKDYIPASPPTFREDHRMLGPSARATSSVGSASIGEGLCNDIRVSVAIWKRNWVNLSYCVEYIGFD